MPTLTTKELIERIRQALDDQNLTQAEAARRIGVNRQTVYNAMRYNPDAPTRRMGTLRSIADECTDLEISEEPRWEVSSG